MCSTLRLAISNNLKKINKSTAASHSVTESPAKVAERTLKKLDIWFIAKVVVVDKQNKPTAKLCWHLAGGCVILPPCLYRCLTVL